MKELKINEKITSRDSASLEKYLNDIKKIPLLTIEEEVSLAKRIKEGDESAKEKLINANLRFVVSVAKQNLRKDISLTLGDLINAGNLGLERATKKYNWTTGFKFISYAVWWIRQSIQAEISLYGYNVAGNHRQNLISEKIKRFTDKFLQLEEREPTIEEIAEALNKDVFYIKQVLEIKNIVRIDDKYEENDDPIFELVSDNYSKTFEETQNEEFLKKTLQSLMRCLSPTEKFVIEQYSGLNPLGTRYTFDSIAITLGLGAEDYLKVKNWYKKGLNKLSKEIKKCGKNKADLL